MREVVPPMPARAPRSGGNALTRWLASLVLRAGGWRMVGQWPDLEKVVVIVAPHSSAWDVVWALAAKVALGLGIVFIGKKEAFWGPLGWLLRKFGGVPIDRRAPGGIIEQVATRMHQSDRMWFVLAPEGTRRKVEHWKSGFWKIARRAQVPVFCVGFNYPDKTIRLGELVTLTDDMESDMSRIRSLFAGLQGKHRGV